MPEERLQKILARLGIASRRAAEQLMLEGQVQVNGQVVDRLGTHADPERDHIRVRGKLVAGPNLTRAGSAPRHYFAMFKPRNVITSMSDPEGRPTVADLMKERGVRARVYPVGRLDWDADGLLLLTDDGDLANQVMHPRTHLPKLYSVKVKGVPEERDLDRVRRGVMIERGVRTLPAEVVVEERTEESTRLRVVLEEGRQNQIKRMFELIGHPVRRIRRLSIGPLRLGKMRVGDVRPLTDEELEKLRKAIARAEQGSVEAPAPARPRAAGPARRSVLARPPARPESRGDRRTPGVKGATRTARGGSRPKPSRPRA